jgi:hypothetical protein
MRVELPMHVCVELCVFNCGSTYHICMGLLKFYMQILSLLYNYFICVVVIH